MNFVVKIRSKCGQGRLVKKSKNFVTSYLEAHLALVAAAAAEKGYRSRSYRHYAPQMGAREIELQKCIPETRALLARRPLTWQQLHFTILIQWEEIQFAAPISLPCFSPSLVQ